MKITLFVSLAIVGTLNVHAYEYFVENPYLTYPFGCLTTGSIHGTPWPSNNVEISEQEVMLTNADNPSEQLEAIVTAYRFGCAESNRSQIWLEFSIPEGTTDTARYWLPRVRVPKGDNEYYAMSLAREQNSWDIITYHRYEIQTFGGVPDQDDGHNETWAFVLENKFSSLDFDPDFLMTPSQYNEEFTLELDGGRNGDFEDPYIIEVPSTASLLTADPQIALSGRLSGNWVVEGASDQGMLISISELVPNHLTEPTGIIDLPLLMFLSWYTYDGDGGMLWLTGAVEFAIGDFEVTVPIERVTNGEFLGNKTADREVVGSVTITANSCNDLSFEYELSDIDLGSGAERLQRLFSLETAGYVCRDLEARILTK